MIRSARNRIEEELIADPDDPWLGVNVLTEFVFCPRAGIIEFEKEHDDQGEEMEDPRASVNYMPPHEIASIVREIEQTTQSIIRWIPVPAIALLATLAAGFWLGWCPAVTGILISICLANPIFTSLKRLRELKKLYEYAQSRKATEPDPLVQTNQPINWWELYKAGFESFAPTRKFDDEETHLLGRPWRILRRGQMQIPVFRKRIDGPNAATIFEQHYVRMAAYCYLLEKCTGAQSPYGIVLFGYTFTGVAINADAAWPKFQRGLEMARRTIKELKKGQIPSPPPASLCSGCHHGKPFVQSRSVNSVGVALPAMARTMGADGRQYRSDCGDRFNWIAPHEKAMKKDLHLE